jgi:hypothetical protein
VAAEEEGNPTWAFEAAFINDKVDGKEQSKRRAEKITGKL